MMSNVDLVNSAAAAKRKLETEFDDEITPSPRNDAKQYRLGREHELDFQFNFE